MTRILRDSIAKWKLRSLVRDSKTCAVGSFLQGSVFCHVEPLSSRAELGPIFLTSGQKLCKIICIMKKMLLHSCCGPCSTVVIERLKDSFDLTVFYYNPNIEPKEEYEKRKVEQQKVCKKFDVPFVDFDYDNDGWRKFVAGLENEREGGARCEKCFYYRLNQTAKFAKEHGFDLFATTLSVSPHKNTIVINKVGDEISKLYDLEFLPESFKKKDGYLRSINLSKEFGLYRQNYCGCLFGKNQLRDAGTKT